MADSSSSVLHATSREPQGSRSARRQRREGAVLGIVYGGGKDPVPFSVDARELRHALAAAGAVIDLQLDGGDTSPVLLKELIKHPVTGTTTHIDLLRVRLDKPIQTQVTIELLNTEEAEGVKLGGVLEQPLREVTAEALPNSIPESIQHDIAEMVIGDTLTLGSITAPAGVTIIDDPELVVATITAPRLQVEDEDGIETETEVVGEGEEGAEGEGGDDAGEPSAEAEGDGGDAGSE